MINLKKLVSTTTAICFYLSSTASNASLPPMSLSQMYSYAASGNVRALRAANQRGMNIDIMDRNGDTALCYAIKRGDKTAYNALRSAGANPRHGCTTNISQQQYNNFMNSSNVAGVEETPRAAFQHFNKGEFVISKKVWWTAGALLLVGGGAAIAAAGGGGGGGGGSNYKPNNDNLGDFAGKLKPTTAPANYKNIMHKAQNGSTYSNSTTLSLDNSTDLDGTPLINKFDFTKKMLEFAKYIQVAVKAYENSIADNAGTINLNNATIGLVALGAGAKATNNGMIQINAKNGTLGMVASDKGYAENLNNIYMSFEGADDKHQVVGMYADTYGNITNSGTIKTVSSEASAGSLIGMQGRLLHQATVSSPLNVIKLINSAGKNINLSNTSDDAQTSVNIVGMGSFLDDAFINGSKLLSLSGVFEIENYGNIDLKLSLVNSATYTKNIYMDDIGIVGIRADGNTTATNRSTGIINVEIDSAAAGSITDAHAGMHSVHGGIIKNEGTINITEGQSGYGMIATRGKGSNSEFDLVRPLVVNNNIININSEKGFGMASYHGGIVANYGSIKHDRVGTGIHSNFGTVNNNGTIVLNKSGIGIDVAPNPVETATATEKTNTIITNVGSITINDADDAFGIKAAYGTINNNSSISLINTTGSSSNASYGIYADAGTVNNNGDINLDINNISGVASVGIYTDRANINNKSNGKITFELFGNGIETTSGKVINDGEILLKNGGTGIKSTSGNIDNNNLVRINGSNPSVGIENDTGLTTNNNIVEINSNNSTGIKSNGIIYNGTSSTTTAKIELNGKNIKGIEINPGAKVYNYGIISLTSTLDGKDNFGIVSEGSTPTSTYIENHGNISLVGNAAYLTNNHGKGIVSEVGTIKNFGKIEITGFFGYGISSDNGIIENNSQIILNSSGYGIAGDNGSSNVNKGTISITGTDSDGGISFGMYTNNGTARNDEDITIDDVDSYGMFVDASEGQIINNKNLTINKTGSYGMAGDNDGRISNALTGIINVNGSNSYGIYTTKGISYNFGKINLTSSDSVGMYSADGTATNTNLISQTGSGTGMIGMEIAGGQGINSGDINLNYGTGIYVNGSSASAKNDKNIKIVTATNAYGIKVDAGTATNSASGLIELAGGTGMYANSSAGKATNSGNIKITNLNGVGMMSENGGTITNLGTIDARNIAMFASGAASKAINEGTLDKTTTMAMYGDGTNIELTNKGTISSGSDFSMYIRGNNSKAVNDGDIAAIGTAMHAEGSNSNLINNGTIRTGNAQYGMHVVGAGSKAVNTGTINVTGNGTGMVATEGASIFNALTGVINVGATGTGMYAYSSNSATKSKVYNLGIINVNGVPLSGQSACGADETCPTGGRYIEIGLNAEFATGGLAYSAAAINFNSWTEDNGIISVAKGGTFEAPELSGDVYANSDIVENTFEKEYVNKDSFIGDTENLNLNSGSHMFNAELVENEEGKKDVVMKMKEFEDIVSDKSLAGYLDNAYNTLFETGDYNSDGAINAVSMFNSLKRANNQNNFSKVLNNQLGLDFFPSLSRQNLEAIKGLNRQINNSIFEASSDTREIVAMAGYDYVTKHQEVSGAVEGYKENAQSLYALVEKRENTKFSYGLGITLTRLDSKYDNKSRRDDILLHILAPVKYNMDSYTLVSTPRIGYGWGDYDRRVGANTYSADTRNLYYGIGNEIRKDINLLGGFVLEPTAEFNLLGVYQNKTKEENQLTIKSSNNLSVEAGLGLYAKKVIEIDENNTIKARIGGTYYQEIGDTYSNSNASMFGVAGRYNMKGYEADKSRGMISGRFDYLYNNINFFAEGSKFIERDGSYDVKAGVEFRF